MPPNPPSGLDELPAAPVAPVAFCPTPSNPPMMVNRPPPVKSPVICGRMLLIIAVSWLAESIDEPAGAKTLPNNPTNESTIVKTVPRTVVSVGVNDITNVNKIVANGFVAANGPKRPVNAVISDIN